MQPQYLKDNHEWMLGEEIPDCDLFFSQIWLHCFANDFEKNTGLAYKKILCKYNGYHLWFYYGKKDSFKVGENITKRIVNEHDYGAKINENIIKEADKLRAYADTIPQNNLGKLSDKKLWEIYEKHYQIHNEYYTWCWIPVAADMFHNNLTKRLKKYLQDIGVNENDLNNHFITLTQPVEHSLMVIEQQELSNIKKEICKNNELKEIFEKESVDDIYNSLHGNIKDLLQKHRDKYYYTKFIYVAGRYTIKDYIKQIKNSLLAEDDEQKCVNIAKVKEKKEKLMNELNIDNAWQDKFKAFSNFMITKIYRRYAQLYAICQMDLILKEMSKRKNLSPMQVRFMLPDEIREMLLNDKYEKEELNKRTKACIYYAEKDYEQIFSGKEADDLLKDLETEVDMSTEVFHGEIGCPGYAKGRVKIIIRPDDMKKMEDGDILVSIATDPDIVPSIKQAAAMVTEQGGVTSHAAIVSRELNIPCVIGTKIATRVLKDGDIVEVDASNGIVRIIK